MSKTVTVPSLKSLAGTFGCIMGYKHPLLTLDLVYGEENSFSSVLYIPPRFFKAVGLEPSTPGGITWPLCPRLPPKHVAVKRNIPFMISSQLRVNPAPAIREEAVGRANKSPAEQTAGLPSPHPGESLATLPRCGRREQTS